MELTERELPKILKFYHVENLGLVFDGFENVEPDESLYYWHDPKDGCLYVLVLTDFVGWNVFGKDAFNSISTDYYPDHTCNWQVDHWLSCSDKPYDEVDRDDIASWFYWPECGEKCVFAKLKDNVSALDNRQLEKAVPDIDEETMAKRKARVLELTRIDIERL